MAVQRITKVVVDRLAPGETVWDEDVRGFGVRRQRRDATYVLKVRIGGQQRFFTIGRHGAPWAPDEARKEARRLLGEIAAGNDPAATRDSKKAIPTLKWEWIDLARGIARLPDSKSGAKNLYLGEAAVRVLKALPRAEGNPHVIFGDKDGGYFRDAQNAWLRLRWLARLEDVRLHD